MLRCKTRILWIVAASTALLLAPQVWAEEADCPQTDAPETVAEAPAPQVAPEQIDKWIAELDADAFKVREAATKSLIGAGPAAVPATAKAAKGDSAEVGLRAIGILKAQAASENATAQAAAKAALKELAKDADSPAGAQARQALTELDPPKQNALALNNGMAGGQIRLILGGQVAVLNGNVAAAQSVTVVENGRTVAIEEDAKGITVKVTEAGKDAKTKTYQAASAKELKEKHPEAHKLYEEHMGKQKAGMAQIQIAPARAQPRQIAPRGVQPRKIAPGQIAARRVGQVGTRAQSRKIAALIDEASKELDASVEALKGAKDTKLDAEQIAKLIERIEAAQKKLAEAHKGLGD